MPKTNAFVSRESKNGEFSCHIKKDVNKLLDIYCKVNGLNKTQYVNDVLQKEMEERFKVLKV